MSNEKFATSDRQATATTDKVARTAATAGANRDGLPENFVSYTRDLLGDTLFEIFSEALSDEPTVSIRLNPWKRAGSPKGAEPVPWCDLGYYLDSRPAFTFDPLLHAGCYYVQEASSMFVAHVLRQYVGSPALVLDLCAAPGGKSTAALASLPTGSMLVSNEPVRQRAQILSENMQKWGNPNTIVTNNYPRDYARLGLQFDIILCDVPCSGEGMFRKDSGAISEWSAQNVESCRLLQREIVASAWQCLRPGGLLVYSTCTLNAGENEENVLWACEELGAEAVSVDISAEWGIRGSLVEGAGIPVYRFIPGLTRGEGLFMAVLKKQGEALSAAATDRKKAGARQTVRRNHDKKTATQAKVGLTQAMSWLDNPDGFALRTSGDSIAAIPDRLAWVYDKISPALRVVSAGVTLGRVKGRDIVPDQSLALSTALRPDAFPMVRLTYAQAVAFLRKEAIELPDDTPHGFVLVSYRGAALGFVKNIGPRCNNLYPAEWKIKSAHVPEEPRVIAGDPSTATGI